ASLRAHPSGDLRALLPSYLADAHAIEQQSIGLLERAPQLVDDPELGSVFSDHLVESHEHAELLASRLQAIEEDASSLKDAAMRLGALSWGSFFHGNPGPPVKLTGSAL